MTCTHTGTPSSAVSAPGHDLSRAQSRAASPRLRTTTNETLAQAVDGVGAGAHQPALLKGAPGTWPRFCEEAVTVSWTRLSSGGLPREPRCRVALLSPLRVLSPFVTATNPGGRRSAMTVPHLPMGRWRLREVGWFAQGHSYTAEPGSELRPVGLQGRLGPGISFRRKTLHTGRCSINIYGANKWILSPTLRPAAPHPGQVTSLWSPFLVSLPARAPR